MHLGFVGKVQDNGTTIKHFIDGWHAAYAGKRPLLNYFNRRKLVASLTKFQIHIFIWYLAQLIMESEQEKGVKAVNQEFKKYEQVYKNQTYHLSESEGQEQFDEDYQIKTSDMSLFFNGCDEGKKEFAQQLGAAMEGIGFTILTGHGIDASLYTEAEKKIAEFFETTTREERMKYHAKRVGSVNQGYFPMKETTIIHPDLVEGWVFCRRAFNLDNDANFKESDYWPRPGYEPFFRKIVFIPVKSSPSMLFSIIVCSGLIISI